MKMKVRRGTIPTSLVHPKLVGNNMVPAGLSPTVTATLWNKHGDHSAVVKLDVPIPLADANEIVTVKSGLVALYKGQPEIDAPIVNGLKASDGTQFHQIRLIDAIVRRTDNNGHVFDYLVMPGFYIIENHSDGVIWALSPFHTKAWFVEDQETLVDRMKNVYRYFT